MQSSPLTLKEQKRIEALKSLNILDSENEREYDDITDLAAAICDTPIAIVSLVDRHRQWFKAKIGIDICEVDREHSFCTHAIENPYEIMEVNDARLDPRFKDNPYTFGDDAIIFYAGAPLIDSDGNALGTLCVIDHKPRKLTDIQLSSLDKLAKQVVKLFKLYAYNSHLKDKEIELKDTNTKLKNFAGVVSHDMKMPLANMIVTFDILKAKYAKSLDEGGLEYLANLKQSAFKMSDYITNILAHYESDNITGSPESNEIFDINELLESIEEMLDINDNCEIEFPEQNREINTNKIALEQIFLNLIGNSIKYNDKDVIKVKIDFEEDDYNYYFGIRDNGIGIPEEEKKRVFELFSTVASKDRNGNVGNGIGLSTVRKLIFNLGGKIDIKSKVGIGTTIKFSIEKR